MAIAAGNGLVVLDVDADHEAGKFGDLTLAELERQNGSIPPTWTCLTGGGGKHFYFQCEDPALTVGAGFAPGLDYRGAGGYVIAPPSIHPTTRRPYVWKEGCAPWDLPPAALPEWLHKLMLDGRKGRKAAKPRAAETPEAVDEGRRNDTLFRMGASLREKGLTVGEITAALLEFNRSRCTPPLEDREVRQIAESCGRYARGPLSRYDERVKPPDFSDAGNADVFARVYQRDLIFTKSLGWLWWNGQRWERDDDRATAWALELSNRMLHEALEENRAAMLQRADAADKAAETGLLEDTVLRDAAKKAATEAKEYLKHAKSTRSAARIENMIKLSKPALAFKAENLDANPFDLNTPAGIVNLTTGQIRPHERAAYCSQITQAAPDDQGAEMWGTFLDTITCGQKEISSFLQQVAGMSLIGEVYQEGIIIAYGGGRNGKSTYFNALGAVLGDYTGHIDVKTMTTDRQNKGASLATLRGKRLVITGELEEHQRLSVSTLKQISSTDAIRVEEKYRQPEDILPSHTLVRSTNHLPRDGSTDGGTWRRLIVVPFNATIPEEKGIQNYGDVLAREAGGAILAWAIEGAVRFVRNGFRLDVPQSVKEATEAYQEREDWLSNFIQERCIREPNARVGAAELYRAYRNWAADTGDFVRRLNDFDTAMEAAGYQKIKPKNRKSWLGLRLDQTAMFQTYCGATG